MPSERPPPGCAFNRVVLALEVGTRVLSVEEFLAVPLQQRVRYLLQSRLEFFMDDKRIDTREALNSVRKSVPPPP